MNEITCMTRSCQRQIGLAALALLLAGCVGVEQPAERAARQDLQTIRGHHRLDAMTNALPALTATSTLGDFLTFAMLNQPRVQAAYFDWAASVERITVERSLPDPRLTFSMDLRDVVEAVMPGLMLDFPGPGKLRVRAEVASAQSAASYFTFEASVLQAAFDVKKAYYQLHFLEDKILINRETLGLLADLEKLARVQNEVGKVTLQDVLRAQIEEDRMTTEVANLEDARHPLRAQLKAALGLPGDRPDPPLPAQFESTPLEITSDQLFATALARNPRLRAMEAELRLADAGIRLARKSKVPDFNAGLEVDVQQSPVMFRPQAGMTLPIWRDKIAAEIAAAQAGKRSAQARLSAEQIALAVDFADKLFTFRESARNLELLRDRLIPKARLSLAVARAGYLSGQIDFLNLIDAERALLGFQLAEVEARTQRELALAELSLLIVGLPPANAPMLPLAGGAPGQPPPPTR
jgi:outer membrane protein TolC